MKKSHRTVLIGLFLCLAAFLRIWYLDRVPTGIVEDELDYVLNAKAIYHTGGSIVTDKWSPYSLTTVPDETPKAELPYFVSLPFVGPFGLSLFTARIGYALMSILYVFLVYVIAAQLFGFWAGVSAGFIAAINPWSVYYGRTAYDVPIAITAYLGAFYMLIRYKGPKLLWAIIPLCIAFYSYIGTKLVFVPFVILSLIGSWMTIHKRRETIWLSIVGIGSLLVFGLFLLQLHGLHANIRFNQIFTPFDVSVSHLVDSQRRMTLASPFTQLFANKPVIYTKELIMKFFGAFSPSILFTNGEGIATFSLWEHGLFYPIDALFLFLGIGALWISAPSLLILFVLCIGISTLPSVLSTIGTSYVHRSSLMYPFMTIFIGYGIYASVGWVQKKWRLMSIVIVVLVYSIAVSNFVYLYFFRFPYYNSESFGLSQRIYSRYMYLADKHGIYTDNISMSSVGYFRDYIFYTNNVNQQTIPAIRKSISTNDFTIDRSIFTEKCPSSEEIKKGDITYILNNTSPCKELFAQHSMIVIPSLSDGGSLYWIFNDKVCGQYALSSYPTGFTIGDFAVEKLSEKQFCERFIIRYANPLYLPSVYYSTQDKNTSP
jgi:4-amino-4-deoxy-L-arabinose transferase-like glycosyltransferase